MMPVMAAISGIEPAAGMHHTPPREEKGGRAVADFGDKQRAARKTRGDDKPSDGGDGKGRLLDIEV